MARATEQYPRRFLISEYVVFIMAWLAAASLTHAQTFLEGQLTRGKTGLEVGQGFVIGLGIDADAKPAVGEEVRVLSVRFACGGEDEDAQPISLAILPTDASDFNGDPDGSKPLHRGHPAVLAISRNQVDPAELHYGDPLVFEFDNDVRIPVGQALQAVFVTLDAEGNLTPRRTSVLYAEYVQEPDGLWVPKSNYGDPENLAAAALSADQDGDGWLQPARDGADLFFTVEYRQLASMDIGIIQTDLPDFAVRALTTDRTNGTDYSATDGHEAKQQQQDPDHPPRGNKVIASHSDFALRHYPKRIIQFQKNPLEAGQIVMLGDSHTEICDWNQAIQIEQTIRNRGISGDTTDGVLHRLDEIVSSRPSKVFVLIGTNDLWSENSAVDIANNIKQIAKTIRTESPGTQLYIQSIFPLRSHPDLNRTVTEVNKDLADGRDEENYSFIDIAKLLTDEHGLLRKDVTYDGCHLNDNGYAIWAKQLKAYIETTD